MLQIWRLRKSVEFPALPAHQPHSRHFPSSQGSSHSDQLTSRSPAELSRGRKSETEKNNTVYTVCYEDGDGQDPRQGPRRPLTRQAR